MKQTRKNIFATTTVLLLALAFAFTAHSCNKDNNDTDIIPNVPVSVMIDMDLPGYYELTLLGHYIYYDGGSKGLIIYHGYDNEYYCFDRNCSYQPLTSCAKVEVEDNRLYARCGHLNSDSTFTECCASRFELASGYPSNGPAQRPLKQYIVNRSGNTLFINN